MVTKEVTVEMLREVYPKRFEKEYYEWLEYAIDGEWWDYHYKQFKADCLLKGIRVDGINFSGFGSQGDGATFSGYVDVPQYMEDHGLHEIYPALYLAVLDDGSRLGIGTTCGYGMQVNNYCMYGNQTAPSGVFENLDQLAWEELIDEQEAAADLATVVVAFCRGLAAELYKDLEAEHEYLTSEEQFVISCGCNEILFDIEIEGEDDEVYC